MSPLRRAERRLLRSVEHGVDAPEPPGPVLRHLGFAYLRARHCALHRALRAGLLWLPSPWRLAIALALKPGDVCLDLGANVGRVTQEAAWRVGATGTVHSFEPSPTALARLRRRVERLGLDHVVIHPCAVGDRAGDGELFEYAQRDGGASSLRPQNHTAVEPSAVRTVPVVTVDVLLPELFSRPPALVKIDVEGAEVEALQGASELLTSTRPRPVLVVEAAIVTQSGFGRGVQPLLDTLYGLGYAAWACRHDGLTEVRRETDLPPHRRREDLLGLHSPDHGDLLARLRRLAARRVAS